MTSYRYPLIFISVAALSMYCLASLAQYPESSTPTNNLSANVDYGPYMTDLQRRVKKYWLPPKSYKERKRVTVAFKIHRNGALSDLHIEHSSGSEIADKAALDAVEKASPLLPLPIGESKESVESTFTFDYNMVNNGKSQ